MKTPTELRRELARLDYRYGAAYAKADVQLRSRPFTLGLLYAKDLLRIACTGFSSAVIGIPSLWFWGAVSDLEAARQSFAGPIDSPAVWAMIENVFWTVFIVACGVSLLLGHLGRARVSRTHADAQLFFVQEDPEALSAELKQVQPAVSVEATTPG